MERLMGHLIEPLELPYKIDTVVIFIRITDEENEIREAGQLVQVTELVRARTENLILICLFPKPLPLTRGAMGRVLCEGWYSMVVKSGG